MFPFSIAVNSVRHSNVGFQPSRTGEGENLNGTIGGYSKKILVDLQRFLSCRVLAVEPAAQLSQEQVQLFKEVASAASSFTARCNLLFRANIRLRTGGSI